MKITPFKIIGYSLVLFLMSCNEEDGPVPATDRYVNGWIMDVMQDVYLWREHLPTVRQNELEESSPEDFFESILYSADRFSFIHPNYADLINSLQGVELEAGYEFVLSKINDTDVIAIVTYIKESSPAAASVLKRGDRISSVNGQGITVDNFREVLDLMSSTHTLEYASYNSSTDSYEDQAPLTLNTIELAENPHLLDTVYQIENHKIGYHIYNFFSDGPSATYDEQMDEIFARFQSEGITDLILDLRYNSGGRISSANNLASLIGSGVSENEIFYQEFWNNRYRSYNEEQNFLSKSGNIGTQLSGTVYVITGPSTASASELVINGLIPYMNVVLVGRKTVGKNVGSIPIDDDSNPNNTYGLLPIVLRIANSQGNSDYENGFLPDIDNEINEFEFPMLALGDRNEVLLSHTISLITGQTDVVARKRMPEQSETFFSSRMAKIYSGLTIIEE